MGQQQSARATNWRTSNAVKMLPVYVKLFGQPYIMVNKSRGTAIWYTGMLKNRKLFGLPLCFRKVMLLDDPIYPNNLWLFFDLDVSDAKFKTMLDISENFGYDRSSNSLWVSGKNLTEIFTLAKFLTDVAVDNLTADEIVSGKLLQKTLINSNGNIGLKKEVYTKLCENLAKNKQPKTERFMDDPWYAVNEPYASNNPLTVVMGEIHDRSYYDILDQVWAEKKASDSVYAFPRAPTGKPSVENLFDLGQKKKMTEKLNHQKKKTEGMINFDAYKRVYKPGTEVPILAALEKKTF